MSLILGIHLLERFYLVSDTRASVEKSTGTETKDDLIKCFTINSRMSAVAAGGALPASYILNKLRDKLTEQSTISSLIEIINSSLTSIINDYVNETGYHSGTVALIIGGFNVGNGKLVEVSLLGRAMSSMVKAAGEGVMVNQSVDNRLTKSLLTIAGKEKGDLHLVEGVCPSEMFSVIIDIATADWKMRDVRCYEFSVFHPEQGIKTVAVPDELLSRLEFRSRENQVENNLYEEAEVLSSFVRHSTNDYKFGSVGGHTFVLLQTPHGCLFPTGHLGKMVDGMLVKAGSLTVEEGKLVYELEDGTSGVYRHLEEIYLNYRDKKLNMSLDELL